MLAERMDIPELAVSEDEGKQFMQAAQNVMRHYSVETTQKTLDWIAFAGTSAGIYGTRVAAYNFRKKQEAAPKQPQAPAAGPMQVMPTYEPEFHG